MRHTNLATTLALLFASGVYAVPARNADIRALQPGSNASPMPLQQPGIPGAQQQDNGSSAGQGETPAAGGVAGGSALQGGVVGAPVGLVALPGEQFTTGGLQPLPGAATASAIQSSAAVVETSVAVVETSVTETSAVLGEVTSEPTAALASSMGLQLLNPSAGAEPTSIAELMPLPGLTTAIAQSSSVAELSPLPGVSSVAGSDTVVATATATGLIGGFQTIGAGAGTEASATSALGSIETPATSEALESLVATASAVSSEVATASLGGFQTISAGTATGAEAGLEASATSFELLPVETSLTSSTAGLSSAFSASITASLGAGATATGIANATGGGIAASGTSAALLQSLPRSAAAGSASGSLIGLPTPTTFATATASVGEEIASDSLVASSEASGILSASGSLEQLPGTAAATGSEASLQPLPGQTSGSALLTSGALATATASVTASESLLASVSQDLASQTDSFASVSSGTVLNSNGTTITPINQGAAARDVGSVLFVSLVAGVVGFVGVVLL
ncbi:hypothetical protein F4679DRAFT_464238 [Xylaria curta]|nr:hypothetical protein F4679DRAFT_464238 [Xylaria curta]